MTISPTTLASALENFTCPLRSVQEAEGVGWETIVAHEARNSGAMVAAGAGAGCGVAMERPEWWFS
jgi:hypothetical protein